MRAEQPPERFAVGPIVLDVGTHQVYKHDVEISLTQQEFALLKYLLRHKGKVCRRQLIENVLLAIGRRVASTLVFSGVRRLGISAVRWFAALILDAARQASSGSSPQAKSPAASLAAGLFACGLLQRSGFAEKEANPE